jgi:1,4-dihydroxy-2-naphthoate octaprenyltransferase
VLGTTYTQAGWISWPSVVAAVGVGALACAILVANNLRDVPTDAVSGKRTLAVVLGELRTRLFYAALLGVAGACLLALVAATPWVLIGAVAVLPAGRALGVVLSRASGLALVPVLRDTGLAELTYAAGVAIGLALV